MNKYLIIFLWAMVGAIPAIAQNGDSFEAFRKAIKNNFNTFREKVLDDYDKYLDGVWTEYHAFRGKERSRLPKPRRAPIAETISDTPVVQTPIHPEPQPEIPSSDRKPIPVSPGSPATQNGNSFDFYNLSIQVPTIGLKDDPHLFDLKDFAGLWRMYLDKEIALQLIPALQHAVTAYNLNDWFIFELIRSYVNYFFPKAGPKVRISLEHYLLTYWGYDVRIGIENTLQPILLVAVEQMVYARAFTEINGQRYYIFYDSRYNANMSRDFSFTTCDLPKDAVGGYALDLVIHQELKIPFVSHPYLFKDGNLEIKGEINANLISMLYHYPQIPIRCYAQSVVNKATRDQVVEQLRNQLANLPQHKAVDAMLRFVQSAFEYATDDEQHGFEKPYFFEEILFYPQCDCEDRSIFYSYLLWHVLGVENQLIGYPGHESVAVHLPIPIEGDGYFYEGKSFYISDPTYIGAVTGMCMPTYRNKQPKIDFVWQGAN